MILLGWGILDKGLSLVAPAAQRALLSCTPNGEVSMTSKLQLGRRGALTLVAGTSVAAIAGASAEAADVTLSCWTGYPELVPWYKERGDAYAKDHPGFSLNVLSTTLREHEQKLVAAMPTGTGPDLFDVGLILSIEVDPSVWTVWRLG
jgi:hypothetical protein